MSIVAWWGGRAERERQEKGERKQVWERKGGRW